MELLAGFMYGLSIYPIILKVPTVESSHENRYSYMGDPDYNYYEEEESDNNRRHIDRYYQDYSRYYNEGENGIDYYSEEDMEEEPSERGEPYYEDEDEDHEDESYGGEGGYSDHTGYYGGYKDGEYAYSGATSPGGANSTATAVPPATTVATPHSSGFKDQKGFKGMLKPGKGSELLPWGIEGVVIVIAAIIVFAIIIIAIVGLIAWLCGIRKAVPFLTKKENELKTRWRDEWSQKLTNISANVYSAFEKFSDAEVLKKADRKSAYLNSTIF